jgi:RNA polymerase sigma-70 factor (ECF subfamily)
MGALPLRAAAQGVRVGKARSRGERRGDQSDVDPAVLRAARAGDPDAFVALFDHYDRRLRALAFRMLADNDQMDDALQETVIKAFRALPTFKGNASVGTWLYRITYTTCVDQLTRGPRRAEVPAAEPPDPLRHTPDVADLVMDRLAVERALLALSRAQRALVFLVFQQGFDHQTASEILGIPLGTVSSRLFAARSVLRKALGGDDLPVEDS